MRLLQSLGKFGYGLMALALLAFGTLAVAQPARALTVDDILSKKKLVVGVLTDFPPYGGTDSNQKPAGYDADVARLMAKYLGVELDLVPVTGPNRIPYLLTNKIDVLIATFGITPERAKQVQFSIPYSSIDVYLLAPKKLNIKGPADLKGVKIAVARASTQDASLTAIAPKEARIMRFDDDASAIQALLSGQADALGAANVVLAQLTKSHPELQLEPKITLRHQPNGIALRRQDTDLHQWVNTFIFYIRNNGELDAIHRKWLGVPLPELSSF
ncbi:MAG TPA: transporter substrate-binding domain-containing protein [Alphaproteobacteria bacterium]|nr:transporter substrate-binding domain-containing protein [Alphaproteobacteria bacterium]